MFDTKPLLGPDQAQAMQEDMRSLEAKLHNPHIEDKAEVGRQLRRVRQDFETQLARPPENPVEEDRMVKRANLLLSEVLADGPCSHEEMRKAPPGAVEKHRLWEKRNKAKLLEWKNIHKRLHAQDGDREAWNFEKHRPYTSTLPMDNAFIPGKDIHLPPVMTGLPVTFDRDQIELLKTYDPKLAAMLGTLDNSQRATVKELIAKASDGEGLGLAEPSAASIAGKMGMERKRKLSKEHKEKLAAGRAAAKAKREAKE